MTPLEAYLEDLLSARIAGAVAETSGYAALANLLNDVGSSLKPTSEHVRAVADGGFASAP